jgi:hypothetical protein
MADCVTIPIDYGSAKPSLLEGNDKGGIEKPANMSFRSIRQDEWCGKNIKQ